MPPFPACEVVLSTDSRTAGLKRAHEGFRGWRPLALAMFCPWRGRDVVEWETICVLKCWEE